MEHGDCRRSANSSALFFGSRTFKFGTIRARTIRKEDCAPKGGIRKIARLLERAMKRWNWPQRSHFEPSKTRLLSRRLPGATQTTVRVAVEADQWVACAPPRSATSCSMHFKL